jgi:hypothetical protein
VEPREWKAVEEIETGPDRVAAIVAAALVEAGIADIISHRLDLHADIVFGKGRVGGDTESPVRFRLSLRRAEIVVVVPPLEPISIDKKSVSRDAPKRQGRLTEVMEKSARAHAAGKLAISASPAGFPGSASVEAGLTQEAGNF